MAGTVNALVRDNLADGSSADEQLEFMQDRGFQAELLGLCKKARQVQPRDYIVSNKSIAARTWHKSFEHAYRAVSEATLTTVAFKTGVTACSPLLMAVASINNLTKSHYKVVKRRSGCGKVQFTCKGFHCDNTYQGSQISLEPVDPSRSILTVKFAIQVLGSVLKLAASLQAEFLQQVPAELAKRRFSLACPSKSGKAGMQSGNTQQAVAQKRSLDDVEEVYGANKQRLLSQISQQTIKQRAEGSMSILDMLSAGNAPPATLQLLQTIRHNVTARLRSMIESGMQGMLAIEAAPQQQQELSINQQAQRWTVKMYASSWACLLQPAPQPS